MSVISAKTVKELRDLTGLGMMECKNALKEANGDLSEAEKILRIRSGSKATKVAGRIAAEGLIATSLNEDCKAGAMIEVNCETDFVAKDVSFKTFVDTLASIALRSNQENPEVLGNSQINNESVESSRQGLVMKLGENITLRRISILKAKGKLSSYLHGGRIGVLVDLEGGDQELGKDIAMHIAAMRPLAVSEEQVPTQILEKERKIAEGRAVDSGKSIEIVKKIVEGGVRKFLAEVTLVGQKFVKNDKQTVGQVLKSRDAVVHGFEVFEVGQGLEKKSNDFVAEVEAQVSKAQ